MNLNFFLLTLQHLIREGRERAALGVLVESLLWFEEGNPRTAQENMAQPPRDWDSSAQLLEISQPLNFLH